MIKDNINPTAGTIEGIYTVRLLNPETGEVVEEHKKHNAITNAVLKQSMILGQFSPFSGDTPYSYSGLSGLIYQYSAGAVGTGSGIQFTPGEWDSDLFSYIVLTDNATPTSKTTVSAEGRAIAGASHGTLPTQVMGTLNDILSGFDGKHLKYVYDFPTTSGNGTFQSCYMTSELNVSDLNNAFVPKPTKLKSKRGVRVTGSERTTAYHYFHDAVANRFIFVKDDGIYSHTSDDMENLVDAVPQLLFEGPQYSQAVGSDDAAIQAGHMYGGKLYFINSNDGFINAVDMSTGEIIRGIDTYSSFTYQKIFSYNGQMYYLYNPQDSDSGDYWKLYSFNADLTGTHVSVGNIPGTGTENYDPAKSYQHYADDTNYYVGVTYCSLSSLVGLTGRPKDNVIYPGFEESTNAGGAPVRFANGKTYKLPDTNGGILEVDSDYSSSGNVGSATTFSTPITKGDTMAMQVTYEAYLTY